MDGETPSSALPELISPSTLASPGGHCSHAVVANGMVYVAGQLPITPDGRQSSDSSPQRRAAW
jgi:enamine deaminase RidA (YjgF/YER057c/UK114 family)